MLSSLHIENIAVIRRADLDLGDGFSVLTGETGAGKSILIDSINLLLGNRASRTLLRTGAEYATVSAVFEQLSPSVVEAIGEMGFSVEDGALMLVEYRGERMVRKLLKLDGGRIQLQAFDHEFSATVGTSMDVRVLGRCVKLERRL